MKLRNALCVIRHRFHHMNIKKTINRKKLICNRYGADRRFLVVADMKIFSHLPQAAIVSFNEMVPTRMTTQSNKALFPKISY